MRLPWVFASLWNFRAFAEREFHRIDHMEAAMGVLVHPNYSDELANGVAVSFDPIDARDDVYYVNTQIGEDLVTNPEAHSVPEEILLYHGNYYNVLGTSNQVPPGQLLLTTYQLTQLRRHLEVIHEDFTRLYKPGSSEPFAMEIEFKITSENILAIKQARPWVFRAPSARPAANNPATGAPTISGTAQVDETLMADTSNMADEDGLTNVSYTYQWMADDADISGATGISYTLVQADESKAITVQISFTDDAGNNETLTSAATGAVSAAEPTEPPAKPTGLSATASHDSVTLTWDDPGDDSITGYVILRRVRENDVGGEFSELVPDTGSTATTYTDDTVVAGITYTYRIKAINEHGVSERSRWFHIDTPAAPVLDKPTGLSATATHDQVVLTWDDPGDDSITGYVILRRHRYDDPKDHFDELVTDTGTAATTYTDDTVKASTAYTYRIKAINEYGVSERSRWFHIDTLPVPVPAKPKGLTATASYDQVVLTWDDPNDDTITGYVILRRNRENTESGQFSPLVPDTGTAATTYTDDKVAPNTPYTYRIKAINEYGVSERSRWFHIDTPAAPDPADPP